MQGLLVRVVCVFSISDELSIVCFVCGPSPTSYGLSPPSQGQAHGHCHRPGRESMLLASMKKLVTEKR